MIEAGTSKPAAFDIVVVHSFSRFFRDHFELEFYVRKPAKNGVELVSITQEMGDDPMHVMMRQIMTLFDEYQSKENARHVLRALKENARQGFWNGARPPIGYRIVAAEQRGAKVKKKLEIGRSTPMEKLDSLVAEYLADRLLQPGRLEEILASVLDRRQERAERRREHIAKLNKRAAETDLRLKRLYDAIGAGVADLDDLALKERIASLGSPGPGAGRRRAATMVESSGQQAITPQMVRKFARTARERIGIDSGYRRDHLGALAPARRSCRP